MADSAHSLPQSPAARNGIFEGRMLAFGQRSAYSPRMTGKMILVAMLLATGAVADDAPVPDIADFYDWTDGQYQVLAQGGRNTAMQVNLFMNEMLKQYSRFFSNWQPKAGARVIVFTNLDDFRAYTAHATKMTHQGLLGYCHLKN